MGKITLPKTSASRAPVPPKSTPTAPSLSRSKFAPSALAKLKDSADELNSITDQTADMVRDIEEYLSIECSIGFDLSIVFENKPGGTTKKSLEYRRIGQNYRIAVCVESIYAASSMKSKAWSDCNRDLKIKSIQHLPDLIEAITKKVEDDISRAEESATTVADVFKSLIGNEG